jgi:signal transduction histidine kinase
MSEALQELATQYAAAFQEYLSGANEAALQRAYELGHDAMTRGLRMLDLAAIHHEALLPALLSAGTPEERAGAAAAAISFFMESLSPFEMSHQGFLEANATLRRLNQTLERQVQEVQAAHTAAEAAEQRARFLAEASMRLDTVLDYRSRLGIVAHLPVPELADYCLIDAVEENGEVCRVEVAAADPAKEAWLRDLRRPLPLVRNEPAGVARVLRTGRSELWPEVSDALLAALAPDDEQRRWLRQLGLRSAMIVLLPARGRTIAVMTLLTAESGRCYGPEELALAEDFARRAAITLDNARLYREVQEAARRKDEFLAMLAHELRNPLAAVANAAHLLRRGVDPSRHERAREVIERRVHHLNHLIDDLLDVSRITRGEIALHFERVDLTALIGAGLEDQRLALPGARPPAGPFGPVGASPASSLTLVSELSERRVWVNGDPTRLAQVLDNLLAQAVKFSEPGGQITVGLETDTARHEAILTVRDTEVGIEPKTQPGVFDLFTQADRTLDHGWAGLGLGLAVIKGLVELHGGEVTAHSAGYGQGTTFTVCLPWEG